MAKPPIPFALSWGEKLCPGLLRILTAMGGRAHELGAKPDRDLVDSIHDLRTLIKRLRAYLWFFKPVLGEVYFAQSNATLRKAAQSLSSARDMHAVKSALTKAAPLAKPGEKRQTSVELSLVMAGKETASKKSAASSVLVKKSAQTVTRMVAQTISKAKLSRAKWPTPNHRVKKALRSLRKAEKKARHPDDTVLIHAWRKKAKRLFYILQLTERVPEMAAGVAIKQVDKLQELLGDHQDAVVAENYLRRHARELGPDELVHARFLLKKSRKALLEDARRCWQKMRRDF